MIKKIDPGVPFNLEKISHSVLPLPAKNSSFDLVLQGELDAYKPLEMIMIDCLCRVIESVLSSKTTEETDSFSSFRLPFNLSSQFSGSVKQPSQLSGIVNQNKETGFVPEQELVLSKDEPIREAVPAVSNNSQEGQDFGKIIEKAARQYGVEPAIIRAVISVESGGNTSAVSPAGAQGLMQLMPGTARELGVRNSFDPAENIMAGTRYLRQLLDRYRGNTKLALAAYNWGMGNLEKRPGSLPKETQNFILRVENHYRTLAKASQSV
jgi:hypothetical protein